MKLRRNALTVLIFALCILIFACVMPVACRGAFAPNNGETGIIGGADAPTYMLMLTELFGGLPFVLVLFGIGLVVSSSFCLCFPMTVKTHCNKRTTAISVALSAVSALGLFCAFAWLTILSFKEISKHPIEYPAGISLGLLSFSFFIGLSFLYFKERKTNLSVKGVIIDALTCIVFLPAFFFAFSSFYEMVF